jgi:hypothetical protein
MDEEEKNEAVPTRNNGKPGPLPSLPTESAADRGHVLVFVDIGNATTRPQSILAPACTTCVDRDNVQPLIDALFRSTRGLPRSDLR